MGVDIHMDVVVNGRETWARTGVPRFRYAKLLWRVHTAECYYRWWLV